MSTIRKQDTEGTKPLLGTGELGFDNYPAGGDAGRVYVGTGATNVPLARKDELPAVATTEVAGLVEKAITAEAIAGMADKFPDAAGVKAHVDARVTVGTNSASQGALTKVGDYGNGRLYPSASVPNVDFHALPESSYFNGVSGRNGVFAVTGSTNTPPKGSFWWVELLVLEGGSCRMVATTHNAFGLEAEKSIFFKDRIGGVGGTWTAWVEVLSTAHVTSSPIDTTPDKLLKVGDGGIISAILLSNEDLNSVVHSGFYRLNNNHANAPEGLGGYGQLIVSKGSDTVFQMYTLYTSSDMYIRTGNPPDVGGAGIWQPWTKVLTTINTGSIVSQSYEEGTWIPAAGDGCTGLTVFGGFQPKYTRIGNRVVGTAAINATKTAGFATYFNILGLPFLCAGAYGSVVVHYKSTQLFPYHVQQSLVYPNTNYATVVFDQTIPDGTNFDVVIKFDYTII